MTLVTGESLCGRGRAGWDLGGLVDRGFRLGGGGLAGKRIWLRVGLRGSGSAREQAREQLGPRRPGSVPFGVTPFGVTPFGEVPSSPSVLAVKFCCSSWTV
jgi:hypothetical protein